MTTEQAVETSVPVNSNSPIQYYVHPDDQTQPTFEILISFAKRLSLSLYSSTFMYPWAFNYNPQMKRQGSPIYVYNKWEKQVSQINYPWVI